MPRTRPTARAEKTAEILRAAEAQLRAGGYEALSVAGLARDLGLAQNTLYWYFPSRDHLFVAALDSMLVSLAVGKPTTARAPITRILWFTDRLEPLWPLLRTLYEIQERSEVAREFLARIDELITTMLGNAFRESVPSRDLTRTVAAFRATVEGVYARGLDTAERHRILRFTFGRLVS
ncbi:MAG: transcriptional regulator, TetR family [Nocardioides sp.]|nr:transcriptional regulator, TetR family [Nocardioides sp.]